MRALYGECPETAQMIKTLARPRVLLPSQAAGVRDAADHVEVDLPSRHRPTHYLMWGIISLGLRVANGWPNDPAIEPCGRFDEGPVRPPQHALVESETIRPEFAPKKVDTLGS